LKGSENSDTDPGFALRLILRIPGAGKQKPSLL